MLGGADNPNGELLSYIIGADKSTGYCFLVKFTLKKVVSDNIRAGIPAFLCSLYNSVLVIRIFNISLFTMVHAIIHSLTLRTFSFKWDKKCFFVSDSSEPY